MHMTTRPTSTRSGSDMTERLYWPSWFLAALLTGVVTGFMLGHRLILARSVAWLLLSSAPAMGRAYPAFRATAGRTGLDAFYAVAGLQLVGTSAFLLVALMAGRPRARAPGGGGGGAPRHAVLSDSPR